MPRFTLPFFTVAGGFWGIALSAVWLQINDDLVGLDRCVALALTVLTGIRLVTYRTRDRDRQAADRDKDALVYALADLSMRRGVATSARLKQTLPLPLLRRIP